MPETNDNPIQEVDREPVPWKRGFGNILVFLMVFVSACFVIGRLLEIEPGVSREGGTPRAKIRWFAENKDKYDLVFVGSSRIYRQMAPAIFDRKMREIGRRMHSFNFGIPAMRLPETLHMVDWILAQEPERLKWLVIELQDLSFQINTANLYSNRVIAWHSLDTLSLAFESVRRSDDSAWEKWKALEPHLLHTLFNQTNVGTAVQALTLLLGYGGNDFTEKLLGQNRDGFRTLALETNAAVLERHRTFVEQPEVLQDRARRLMEPMEQVELDPVVEQVIKDLVARVRARDVEPLFIITPGNTRYPELIRAKQLGVIPKLFAFNVPGRYPDFYRVKYHYDLGHLNARGASIFSETFAAEFSEWLRQ